MEDICGNFSLLCRCTRGGGGGGGEKEAQCSHWTEVREAEGLWSQQYWFFLQFLGHVQGFEEIMFSEKLKRVMVTSIVFEMHF